MAEGIGCCHGWRDLEKTGWKIAEQLGGLDDSRTMIEVLVGVGILSSMALEDISSVDIEAHHRLTRARHSQICLGKARELPQAATKVLLHPEPLRAASIAAMFLAVRRTSALLSHPCHAITSSRCYQSTSSAANTQLSPRWLSDVKTRVGACLSFGLTAPQMALAGSILEEIADDWRELVAGSEGYLTSPTRRGLYRWPVAWGEQDSMVCLPLDTVSEEYCIDSEAKLSFG